MALVKKTIELDQEQLTRLNLGSQCQVIHTAGNLASFLQTRVSEKEAINIILQQFDTEIQLAEVTLKTLAPSSSRRSEGARESRVWHQCLHCFPFA